MDELRARGLVMKGEYSTLMIAIIYGFVDVVKVLIENGANVNQQVNDVSENMLLGIKL